MIGIVTVTILAVLMLGELSLTKLNTPRERVKFSLQSIAGIIVCLLPFVVSSWVPIFIFSAVMSFLIFYSHNRELPFFKANLKHPSYGSRIYPIVFFGLFLLQHKLKSEIYFSLPVLLFLVSDGLAVAIGTNYRWRPYTSKKGSKTLAGSLAFFSTAFMFSAFCVYFFNNSFSYGTILGSAFVISFLATVAEALFYRGWDNLTVPLVSTSTLYVLINYIWP